ncbi:hypothetical protein Acr_27g0001000 [Actinidia rufa]|uniref:Uncharacterized protein n=1 Tax=Actinidia rufa TaxID=165716 RepID=A0A7J0H5Q9_9ERIC|nr:hypothetical protein Acr_27g0001000 [Actinidia rufa]
MFGGTFSHHPSFNVSMREHLRANGLREPPLLPPNCGGCNHIPCGGNVSIHENSGAETPPCRSIKDYIQANELKAQEPCNMSLRERLRANGQREPPRPPPNLGGCNQFNLGRTHEGTFSKHYQDFLQTYKNPFDYFHEAGQIYYHHEHLEYPPPSKESFNANHLDFYPNQEQVHPIKQIHLVANLRIEDTIDQITFPQDFKSKENVPKVSDEIIENESLDEKCERGESEIGDSEQEEKGSTEITLNGDFGLLDVGDVHVKEDVNSLEAIPTMSRDHEIPTFKPLVPSPNLSEPLELHVPTLEPNIIPMADQIEEGEGIIP